MVENKKRIKYAIRKTTVGVASVAIAAFFLQGSMTFAMEASNHEGTVEVAGDSEDSNEEETSPDVPQEVTKLLSVLNELHQKTQEKIVRDSLTKETLKKYDEEIEKAQKIIADSTSVLDERKKEDVLQFVQKVEEQIVAMDRAKALLEVDKPVFKSELDTLSHLSEAQRQSFEQEMEHLLGAYLNKETFVEIIAKAKKINQLMETLKGLEAESNQIQEEKIYLESSQQKQDAYVKALAEGMKALTSSETSEKAIKKIIHNISQTKASLDGETTIETAKTKYREGISQLLFLNKAQRESWLEQGEGLESTQALESHLEKAKSLNSKMQELKTILDTNNEIEKEDYYVKATEEVKQEVREVLQTIRELLAENSPIPANEKQVDTLLQNVKDALVSVKETTSDESLEEAAAQEKVSYQQAVKNMEHLSTKQKEFWIESGNALQTHEQLEQTFEKVSRLNEAMGEVKALVDLQKEIEKKETYQSATKESQETVMNLFKEGKQLLRVDAVSVVTEEQLTAFMEKFSAALENLKKHPSNEESSVPNQNPKKETEKEEGTLNVPKEDEAVSESDRAMTISTIKLLQPLNDVQKIQAENKVKLAKTKQELVHILGETNDLAESMGNLAKMIQKHEHILTSREFLEAQKSQQDTLQQLLHEAIGILIPETGQGYSKNQVDSLLQNITQVITALTKKTESSTGETVTKPSVPDTNQPSVPEKTETSSSEKEKTETPEEENQPKPEKENQPIPEKGNQTTSEKTKDEAIKSVTPENSNVQESQIYQGWFLEGENWKFYREGQPTKGWIQSGNHWYLLDESGNMKTGWVQSNHQWYYLHESGKMNIGWILENGQWYYCNETGAMEKGWNEVNGVWYYHQENGIMVTGWTFVHGKWYFFQENGSLLTDAITPDGYLVNQNGEWISLDQ